MHQYNFLIVSDMHVGTSEDANNSTRLTIETPDIPVHENPFESLKEFIANKEMSFDGIINLGDLTNRGLIAGFNLGVRMMRELSLIYKCPLVYTPGNHDFCYGYSKGPVSYLKSMANYPTDDAKANASFWSRGFCLFRIKEINILICNSGKDYLKIEDKDNVPIFDEQYCNDLDEYLKDELKKGVNIAIVHHHVIQHSDVAENANYNSNDIIEHADSFLQVLTKYHFCCVLHGHKHLSRYTMFNNIAIMACGSLSAIENVRICDERNYFHVLRLYAENTVPKGIIKSYYFMPQKGWLEIVDKNFSVKSTYAFGYSLDIPKLSTDFIGFLGPETPFVKKENLFETYPELCMMSERDMTSLKQSMNSQGYDLSVNGSDVFIFKK